MSFFLQTLKFTLMKLVLKFKLYYSNYYTETTSVTVSEFMHTVHGTVIYRFLLHLRL